MNPSLKDRSRRMGQRVEQRNRKIWSGHPTILEDVTHVLSGIGLALLLYPLLEGKVKPVGWAMILVSTAIHLYADTNKGSRHSKCR